MTTDLQLDVTFTPEGEFDVANIFNGRSFKAYKGDFFITIKNMGSA